MKCDEGKPSCLRCLKFRGECDGYVSPRPAVTPTAKSLRALVPNPDVKAQPPLCAISQQPRTTLFANESENRFFQLFVANTANRLSGVFESDLWSRLVLQACESEASIRHAVIAIGALDMTSMATQISQAKGGQTPNENADSAIDCHRFALKQYSKAISCMREGLTRGNQPLRTALLGCILIVCFETYHGDHKAALSQIQIGLDLMDQWSRSPTEKKSSLGRELLEDEIRDAFGRLDSQAMTFVDTRSLSIHEEKMNSNSEAVDNMPRLFTSIKEARFYSDLLMRRLMHFRVFNTQYHRDTMASTVGPTEAIHDPPEELLANVTKRLSELERWEAAASPLLKRLRKYGTEREVLAGTALEIQYAQSHCSLAATVGNGQMHFDSFLAHYKKVVAKCRVLLASLGPALGSTRFTIDFQCLMALYVVARKCRDPVVRRDAIALLLSKSWREGVWDSVLAGKIGQWIMEIEEEGMDENGFVPEWSRVRGAEVNFDLRERTAQVRCLRRKSQGSDEMVLREAEMTW